MSLRVAAIVSRLVRATPKSAQDAHHGHDNRLGSVLDMASKALPQSAGSVE